MKIPVLDTNVVIRFWVETPASIPAKFAGVFSFFEKLERGDVHCLLADVVMFQCYYVMTSYYKVPHSLVVEQLMNLTLLRGVHLQNRAVMVATLDILKTRKTDFVDAYLQELTRHNGITGIYSFDQGVKTEGLTLLEIV
jgi:predicted nucleic-acid-binding protein